MLKCTRDAVKKAWTIPNYLDLLNSIIF